MKAYKLLLISVVVFNLVVGCGQNSAKTSRGLCAEADSALARGDYDRAVVLCDSIDSICRDALAERRTAMHLRALAREGIALRGLEQADSLLVASQLESDSLKRLLVWNNNSVEGFYRVKGVSQPTNGIEARVSPDGVFYIVAQIAGSGNHKGLTISGNGGSVSTPQIGRDGERNLLASGHETIHFVGAECDTLGQFVSENRGGGLTLTIEGQPPLRRELSAGERQSLQTAWEYTRSLRNLQVAALEHQKYEQLLGIARSQIARTYRVEGEE